MSLTASPRTPAWKEILDTQEAKRRKILMLTSLVLCSRVHIGLVVHCSLCPYHFLRVETTQKSRIEEGDTVIALFS